MRSHRTAFALSLAILLISLAACQSSSSGVQAAREEEKTINPGPSRANETAGSDNTLSSQDRNLARRLQQTDLEEIDLARYVKDRTKDGDVKSFANAMVDDHNKALNELQDLLKKNDVNQPANVPKPEDEASKLSALQNSSGADFERQYIAMVVRDHQKDLDELHSDDGAVQSAKLKTYIQNLIPILEKHLDRAQDLQNRLNNLKVP